MLMRSATATGSRFTAETSASTLALLLYLENSEKDRDDNDYRETHTASAVGMLLLIHSEMGGGRRAETRAGHAYISKYCQTVLVGEAMRAAQVLCQRSHIKFRVPNQTQQVSPK
jgi:hypothetical protein